MNSEMLSRRALAQFAAVALLFVLGFSALALLVADSGEAGASTASAAAPVSAARPAPSAESRNPYGEMNLAWTEPGMIGVVGWAKDPDVNRPIEVVVAVDRGLFVRTAGVYNPFLPGSYGEKFRSYLVAIPVTPGPHTMCVAALNVGPGTGFRLLGCKVFGNVESADPQGNLEGATLGPSGDRLQVTGWALDRETSAALAVDLTVDGAPAGRVLASAGRPDLASTFPGLGTGHGFTADVAVAPGRRRVCAIARNYNRGADATIGCTDVDVPATSPSGVIDAVSVAPDAIVVSGWAGDPSPRTPINVVVTDRVVGAVDDAVRTTVAATGSRPDVAATTGLDPRAGYAVALAATVPGVHEICVTAVNVGIGADQFLGCRTVSVVDHRPAFNIEGVQPQGSAVTVSGWAFDPDSSNPVTVRVAVDGAPTVVSANQSRPDVGAAFPGVGQNRGFQSTIGVGGGLHTVCVTFVDQVPGLPGVTGDRAPACGSVIVGPTAIGTTGIAGPTQVIGPDGGPLRDVDRDGGVSVTLRDGSVLWLFGDSTAYNGDGSLRYFVGGTAAWASAAQPTITRDAATPSGAPYVLAQPGEGYPACSASRPNRVMWPVSAVKVPDGGRDRVVAFFANMCIGSVNDYEFKGISLAQWFYDPASPPILSPVQFTVINQQLQVTRAFGTASTYDPVSGFAYLYACDRPANPLNVGGYGPCRVARVDPVNIGDPNAYRYFNGSTWTLGESSAQAMDMPQGTSSITRYPAAAFTITFDPTKGVYVMVYSPWPGFIDRAMVRVSRSPQGPWTAPVEITLPGCSNTIDGQARNCYAATAQPAFSTGAELGLGFYDQSTPADRNRGRYLVARVPFAVALS